jgi:hypothetical protein
MSKISDEVIDKVAEAVYFSGRGEWAITPNHVNKKTAELAKEWFINPPNSDMRDDKELSFLAAKAAIQALLDSGEVVPRKDVEEMLENCLVFVNFVKSCSVDTMGELRYDAELLESAFEALAKFTDKRG